MNLIPKFLTTLILISFTLFACEKDERDNRIRIGDGFTEWIGPYSSDGEIYNFTSPAGLAAYGEVILTTIDDPDFFADCQVGGETRQCQYQSVVLELTGAEGEQYNLGITVSGRDKLWLMPTRQGGITTPIYFLNASTGVTEEGYPDLFVVARDGAYPYAGALTEAVIFSQSERNLLFDQVQAPQRVVLVKGRGVVEWDDFSGNTYTLN